LTFFKSTKVAISTVFIYLNSPIFVFFLGKSCEISCLVIYIYVHILVPFFIIHVLIQNLYEQCLFPNASSTGTVLFGRNGLLTVYSLTSSLTVAN
jgi:hypothetical protein